MGVVVLIRRRRAFLRGGEWRSPDAGLEQRLNREMEGWITETGGPHLDSSDPELEAAREIARRFKGKVVGHAPASPRASAQIYFAKRQIKLAFF